MNESVSHVGLSGKGRDHNQHGFLAWLAGAGVKGGASYGETDEIGYKAVVDPAPVHDLHATILHLLGIDPHEAHVQIQRPAVPSDGRGRHGAG